MNRDKFFIFLQNIMPKHSLSRFVGLIANTKISFIKNIFIGWFIKKYQVDMSLAIKEKIEDYQSFNHFFTRELKPNLRPIDSNPDTLVSPVDGSISQIGDIKDGKLFQAKGFTFTLQELLAEEADYDHFLEGKFATLYLAPKDYHRIHMPFEGTLHKTTYIPGELFSVNNVTANHVPQLFAKNERLVCHFHTVFGDMILVLVGACIVGAINTVWGGKVTPPRRKTVETSVYPFNNIHLKKGALLGYFELGSTVIALFPENTVEFSSTFITSPAIKMGQAMGNLSMDSRYAGMTEGHHIHDLKNDLKLL